MPPSSRPLSSLPIFIYPPDIFLHNKRLALFTPHLLFKDIIGYGISDPGRTIFVVIEYQMVD